VVVGALDGNNSPKRFVREGCQSDILVFHSDYFIPQEFVENFKHEVKRKVWKPESSEVRHCKGNPKSLWESHRLMMGDIQSK
jgi:hypothetical protein